MDFAFARLRAKVDFAFASVTKLVSRKQCFRTFGDLPDHTQCGVTKLPDSFDHFLLVSALTFVSK